MSKYDLALIPKLEVTTNSNGTRCYKHPFTGKALPSVTTVLSHFKNKSLQEWKNNTPNHAAISGIATSRGKILHSMIEERLTTGNSPKVKLAEEIIIGPLYSNIEEKLDCITPYFLEKSLYSDKLEVAGTIDCFGRVEEHILGGKLLDDCVVDFKSSKYAKRTEWIEDYKIQVAVYSMMIRETFNLSACPPGKIIISNFSGSVPCQSFWVDPSDIVNKFIPMFQGKLVQFLEETKNVP